MKAIKYKDVKELGFERYQMEDKIFEEHHGYDDFFMELKFGKYHFIWMNENEFVKLHKMKGSNIVSTLRIYTLIELKTLVNFFIGGDKNKIYELNKPDNNNDHCNYA